MLTLLTLSDRHLQILHAIHVHLLFFAVVFGTLFSVIYVPVYYASFIFNVCAYLFMSFCGTRGLICTIISVISLVVMAFVTLWAPTLYTIVSIGIMDCPKNAIDPDNGNCGLHLGKVWSILMILYIVATMLMIFFQIFLNISCYRIVHRKHHTSDSVCTIPTKLDSPSSYVDAVYVHICKVSSSFAGYLKVIVKKVKVLASTVNTNSEKNVVPVFENSSE